MNEQLNRIEDALAHQAMLAQELIRHKGLGSGRFGELSIWERYRGDLRPSHVKILGMNANAAPGDMKGSLHASQHGSGNALTFRVDQEGGMVSNDVLWVPQSSVRGPYVDRGFYNPRFDERTIYRPDDNGLQVAQGRRERSYTGRVAEEIELIDGRRIAQDDLAPRADDLALSVRAATELLIRALQDDRSLDVAVFDKPLYTGLDL